MSLSSAALGMAASSSNHVIGDWSRNWTISFAENSSSADVTVVEIDEKSVSGFGSWPWKRELTAQLVREIHQLEPKILVVDIILPQLDGHLADPVGTAKLAEAIGSAKTVLAALLADNGIGPTVEPPPVLKKGSGSSLSLWMSTGGVWPSNLLQQAASGIGISSLALDATKSVSAVGAISLASGRVYPGLAVETIRILESSSALIYDPSDRALQIGRYLVPISRDANFLLVPSDQSHIRARTVSAADVLKKLVRRDQIRGKVIFLGGSAPETGGLRQTAEETLVSSAQIHADAVASITEGLVPYTLQLDREFDAAAMLLIGLFCSAIGLSLPPVLAASATGVLLSVWVLAVVLACRWFNLVLDPAYPLLAGAISAVVASAVQSIGHQRRAASMRLSFEHHLSPAVVAQLSERKTGAALMRQRRVATVLFTDIEGFTEMTDGKGADAVIPILDEYFAGLAQIIHASGGTIDKIVGDAVHALFNAVTDLEGHPDLAVRCANDIIAFTEKFRKRHDVAIVGLGRTRIGIETGELVIGEVGGGAKRDYTAHGSAINLAARLEALNKVTGTSICIGPHCNSLISTIQTIGIGEFKIKGLGSVPVFTVAV